MVRVLCLVIGYLFGLFQTAYVYGKRKGIDIREHGSGNAGTTNALRVFGTKAGILVFAGDCLKCILAVAFCRVLFERAYPDMQYLIIIYAAAGAILGHNYPFYMNFKGGKGIAATAGLIASIHPSFIPVGLALFFGAFLLTHYVSLGSLLVYAGLVIQLIISGQLGLFGMEQAQLNELYIVGFLLAVMAYWKHRANIARLIRGQERKTYLFKKNSM
jgi:glycerol-3-phosphate acyltransferase PlsY